MHSVSVSFLGLMDGHVRHELLLDVPTSLNVVSAPTSIVDIGVASERTAMSYQQRRSHRRNVSGQ